MLHYFKVWTVHRALMYIYVHSGCLSTSIIVMWPLLLWITFSSFKYCLILFSQLLHIKTCIAWVSPLLTTSRVAIFQCHNCYDHQVLKTNATEQQWLTCGIILFTAILNPTSQVLGQQLSFPFLPWLWLLVPELCYVFSSTKTAGIWIDGILTLKDLLDTHWWFVLYNFLQDPLPPHSQQPLTHCHNLREDLRVAQICGYSLHLCTWRCSHSQ